jgi:hypothetical protein
MQKAVGVYRHHKRREDAKRPDDNHAMTWHATELAAQIGFLNHALFYLCEHDRADEDLASRVVPASSPGLQKGVAQLRAMLPRSELSQAHQRTGFGDSCTFAARNVRHRSLSPAISSAEVADGGSSQRTNLIRVTQPLSYSQVQRCRTMESVNSRNKRRLLGRALQCRAAE